MPLYVESSPLLGARRPCSSVASSPPPRRSPFETGFPTLVASPPIPSPRPHRLSFAYDKHAHHRALRVFLALLVSTVGAGLLSVPYTFLLAPSWAAVAGIAAVGGAMALTANALLLAHVQLAAREEARSHIGAGRKFASFHTLAVVAGGPALGHVVAAVSAVGVFGGCVGHARIVADMAPFLVESALALRAGAGGEGATPETIARLGSYVLWATFALVVFPLCLLKNPSGLRVSNYLGLAFSLYLLSAAIYRSVVALPPPTAPGVGNGTQPVAQLDLTPSPEATEAFSTVIQTAIAAVAPTRVVGTALSRFAQSVSIYNYAFMMHLNLVPLFVQLRGNFAEPLQCSRRKMTRSLAASSGLCVLLYAAFGLVSKRLYGAAVRGNILLNLEHDPAMRIPLVAVFCAVVASFPLLFLPLRGVLEELCFSANLDEIAPATRLGATTVLLLAQVLAAVCVPGIQVVLGLTGATCCLMICIVFPVLFYTKLCPWDAGRGGKAFTAVLWAVALAFTVLGVIATVSLLSNP